MGGSRNLQQQYWEKLEQLEQEQLLAEEKIKALANDQTLSALPEGTLKSLTAIQKKYDGRGDC